MFNRKVKGIFLWVILIALLGTFTACSSGSTNPPASAENSKNAPSSEAPQQNVINLKLAHDQQPDQGYGVGCTRLVNDVKAGTNGSVSIEVFDRGVLGNERDVVEGLKIGTIDMAIITAGTLTNFEKKMAVVNMPFLFNDWDHVQKALEGPVAEKIFPLLEKKQQIKALGVYALGFRNVATTKKEIESVKDFAGLKIRVPQAPVFLSTFKQIGANPTPMAWGELYTSLQTDVVDGFENSAQVMEQFKMYEVTQNLAITNHIWEGGVVLISKKVWDKLSPEQQKVLEKAAIDSAKYQREQVKLGDEKMIKSLQDKGMVVSTLDKAELQDKVKQVYDELGKEYGIEGLIQEIKSLGK